MLRNKDSLWHDLRLKAEINENSEETLTWGQISGMLENMEIENETDELIHCVSGSESDKELVKELLQFGERHPNSCFDYIDNISYSHEEGKHIAVIMVEPLGHIGFRGKDLTELLSYLLALFSAQPEAMSYIQAGNIVMDSGETFGVFNIAACPDIHALWNGAYAKERI